MQVGDGNDNVDSDGSDGVVIVLNPVNDSVCNLQCAVGWYHPQHGNEAPFSCAPETKNRTLSEGIPTDSVTCSSACVAMVFVSKMAGASMKHAACMAQWEGCF